MIYYVTKLTLYELTVSSSVKYLILKLGLRNEHAYTRSSQNFVLCTVVQQVSFDDMYTATSGVP